MDPRFIKPGEITGQRSSSLPPVTVQKPDHSANGKRRGPKGLLSQPVNRNQISTALKNASLLTFFSFQNPLSFQIIKILDLNILFNT